MRLPYSLEGYLAQHHAPCPSCGYDLFGLKQARCPECSMPLDLELLRDGPVRDSAPCRIHEVGDRPATRSEVLTMLVTAAVAAAIMGLVVYLAEL